MSCVILCQTLVKHRQHSINNLVSHLIFWLSQTVRYIFTLSIWCSEQHRRCLEICQLSTTHLLLFKIIHFQVSVEFHFKFVASDWRETCFSTADEDDTHSKRADILKNLPSRRLSLWQRQTRTKMQGKDRSRSHEYEAINNEDSGDDESTDEATSSERKKFEQTEPLSVQLLKLRKRR